MALIDGILDIVLRNPFDDKSKFFKKSQYTFSARFILGTFFAFVGVFGFVTSGLVWEFKGIEFGLTAAITSFIALVFSIVFLFPFTSAKRNPSSRQNNNVQVKAPVFQKVSEDLPGDKINSATTTAEEIRAQLALSDKEKPEIVMVNFSTNY